MHGFGCLQTDLRFRIKSVIDGTQSPEQLNVVIRVCLALATELLERKGGTRRLSESLGLHGDDLAYDCIADLFRRNEHGMLVQLQVYFQSVDLSRLSDAEVLIFLRKLVYSRVNQALFRMYQEVDPAFHKILRNIKLAVLSLSQFQELDRFGESSVAPVLCDTLEHLPPLDPLALENDLHALCRGTENIPEMLGKVALYLRQQDTHSRIVPMAQLARTFQAVYAAKNRPLLEAECVEDGTTETDATATIRCACRKVQLRMAKRYVVKKNITQDTYDSYFDVIERSLIERLVFSNGDDVSYFEMLSKELPGLTHDAYRTQHRTTLEYLGSLAHKEAINQLKRVF